MKIINLVKSVNGIVGYIESYPIDKTLSELDNNNFFTEQEAVERVETLFKNIIINTKRDELEEDIDYYVENGYIEFDNKNNEEIQLFIVWSGINVKEWKKI